MNKPFQNLVPSEGPLDCSIAFIGEAPGQHERIKGKPFVDYAPAGIAFNQMLQTARIYRPDCLVTNLFRDQAPGNNTKIWLDFNRKNPHESQYYLDCRENLKLELEKSSAHIIVAVGGDALWGLCELKDITNRRGSIFESTLLPGRKVIAMRHPAATLPNRSPKLFHLCVFDLIRAREQSEFPEIRAPERNLIINPTFQEAILWLRRAAGEENYAATSLTPTKELSYDYETMYPHGDEITHVSFSVDEKEAICIHFFENEKNLYTVEEEAEIWDWIGQVLENPSIQKVGHNLTFDNGQSFDKYGIQVQSPSAHFDTMIAQVFVNPDLGMAQMKDATNFKDAKGGKSLATVTSMYTEEPYYKDEIRQGGDVKKTYNAKDSAVLPEIKRAISKDLETLGNTKHCEMQSKLIDPLIYMWQRGILADSAKLEEAKLNAEKRIEELKEELNEEVGYEINANSSHQLKKYFYDELKINPYKKRDTGNKWVSTTDKFAMQKLAKGTANRKPISAAKIILQIRHYVKRKGTYYDIALKDGRLVSNYNPVGTKQHRLSASGDSAGFGTNMENQPAEMKEFFLADPGYVAYEMDLRNADLRVTAYIAPEPIMIDAFENDKDIYCRTAGLLLDKDESLVSREKGTCFLCAEPAICGHAGERYGGKKTTLGFNYGWGARDFANQNNIIEKTAKSLRNKYLGGYKGIPEMWRWIEHEIRQTGLLRNCFDAAYRYLMNPDPRTHAAVFQQGYSYIPQSTVADIINWWGLLHIWDNLEHVELLNQVHDSVWFQIPISAGWDYHVDSILSIKRSLEQKLSYNGIEFTIPIECKMGLNFGTMKELELNQEKQNVRLSIQSWYRQTQRLQE